MQQTTRWTFCVDNYEKLAAERLGEPSSAVRARVAAARERQAQRFRGTRLLTKRRIYPPECSLI